MLMVQYVKYRLHYQKPIARVTTNCFHSNVCCKWVIWVWVITFISLNMARNQSGNRNIPMWSHLSSVGEVVRMWFTAALTRANIKTSGTKRWEQEIRSRREEERENHRTARQNSAFSSDQQHSMKTWNFYKIISELMGYFYKQKVSVERSTGAVCTCVLVFMFILTLKSPTGIRS